MIFQNFGFNQNYPLTTEAPVVYDADAQKFITATAISGSTADAINTFVVSLKNDSLWTKFDVIYPFVGNSSASYAYNLVNTGSYYATFVGGSNITYNDSQGVKFNGGYNTFMSTNYNVTNLTRSNAHLSFYKIAGAPSNNWSTVTENIEFGAYNESNGRGILLGSAYETANNTISNRFMSIGSGPNNNAAPSSGSIMVTGDSTHTSIYKGSTEVTQRSWTDSGEPNSGSIAFGAITRLQDAVGSIYYHAYNTSGSYGLATIGQHISGSDATNYYNASQALQTSLSRAV